MTRSSRTAKPSPEPAAADAGTPLERLNEAALLLIRLRPGDLQGVVAARKALEPLAGADAPAPFRTHLGRALERLDALMMGDAEAGAVLAEVSALVERAMNGLEDPEGGADDAPAALPEPAPEPAAAASPAPPPLPSALPADVDLDLLPDFIAESLEYMERAEGALLALEGDPADLEAVNVVFRAFHTIKGTSAFLGFAEISRLAHHAEELFDRFRKGDMTCTGAAADLSLRSVDTLTAMLHAIEEAAAGEALAYPECYGEVLGDLASTAAGAARAPGSPPRLGDLLVEQGKVDRATVEAAMAERPDKPIGEVLVAIGAVSVADVDEALKSQKRSSSGADPGEASVRVRMDRLDQLVDLVGELVVAQSMIAQDPVVCHGSNVALTRKVGQTSKIIRELQDLSMSMRMVPLKPLFQKIQRLVRDVARKSGKFVDFVTIGEDTEIDRNLADLVADPLVHMVRNAIDHGIESPEEREGAGKRRAGTVKLSAYHAGGNVVIELADDGRGLDRERILAKATEKGLVDPERTLSDREVFDLVFAPGFSTAEVVTDLSGRGVGMDVVRRNIEAIRGRIDIESTHGEGTCFALRLPLTLAITDGMLVRVGSEHFIVPTVHIHMSFRPEASALSSIHGRGEMVMLQGEVIPIVRLHRLLDVKDPIVDPTRGLLVIVGEARRRSALLVDELLGQQQFVAKPLGTGLGNVRGIAGGAILGDGRVGLILDATELAGLE